MMAITEQQLIEFARLGIEAGNAGRTLTPAAVEEAARKTAAGPAFRAVVEAAAHYGWQNAAPAPAGMVRVRKGRAVIDGQLTIADAA